MGLVVYKVSYIIDEKEVDVIDSNWKYFVILDGCRYDYFKDVYKEILGNMGNLQKARSSSLGTPGWLRGTFMNRDCKDIILLTTLVKFNLKLPEHTLFKAVNVWKKGWSDSLGTTPPNAVNRAFLEEVRQHPEKRFIIHYQQPHTPYITIGGEPSNSIAQYFNTDEVKKHKKLLNLIPQSVAWTIKKWLKKSPGLPIESYYRLHGKKGLIIVYKNEIRGVLTYVKKLIDSYPGKWIITADHGVTVGERGRYGQCHIDIKEVREVPWLELDNT